VKLCAIDWSFGVVVWWLGDSSNELLVTKPGCRGGEEGGELITKCCDWYASGCVPGACSAVCHLSDRCASVFLGAALGGICSRPCSWLTGAYALARARRGGRVPGVGGLGRVVVPEPGLSVNGLCGTCGRLYGYLGAYGLWVRLWLYRATQGCTGVAVDVVAAGWRRGFAGLQT
jgi:hypothetical protein